VEESERDGESCLITLGLHSFRLIRNVVFIFSFYDKVVIGIVSLNLIKFFLLYSCFHLSAFLWFLCGVIVSP
jgi:hypothetical protein